MVFAAEFTCEAVSRVTARGGFVFAGGMGTTWVTGERVELQPFCGPADLIDTLAARTEKAHAVLGQAEVRQVFRISKIGTVAGSMVTAGVVRRGARFRLLRENVVVYTGEVESVRRLKDDVREVATGFD